MSLPRFIAIDTENTGLHHKRDRVHGLSVAWREGDKVRAEYYTSPSMIRRILASKTDKVGFNLSYDVKMLEEAGYKVEGKLWCVQQMSKMIDESMKGGLKAWAMKRLGPQALSDERALREAMKAVGVRHVGELAALDLGLANRPYTPTIAAYAKEDARNTLLLFEDLGKELNSLNKTVKRVFQVKKGPLDYFIEEATPGESSLRHVETMGIRVDLDFLASYKKELEEELVVVLKDLNRLARRPIARVRKTLVEKERAKKKSERGKRNTKHPQFNWYSTAQLGMLLFEEYGLPAARTASGAYTTTEAFLTTLRAGIGDKHPASPVLDRYARLQKIKKELGTYVIGYHEHAVKVGEEYRIFSNYAALTETGRTSSSKPNLQNAGRNSPVKRAFIPSDGYVFGYLDYSQVELRIAAHVSGDPAMTEVFEFERDPHRETAAIAFSISPEHVTDEQRRLGKVVNFLLIYRGGPKRLQEELEKSGVVVTRERAKELIANYFEGYKVYRQFLDRLWESTKRVGMLVAENGRVRRFPDVVYDAHIDRRRRRWTGPRQLADKLKKPGDPVTLDNDELFERAIKKVIHAEKQAYNFPIQSLGATITKAALKELIAQGFRVVQTVHDSIVLELPAKSAVQDLNRAKEIMENAYQLSVPLKVDAKLLTSLCEDDKVEPSCAA